MWHTSKRRNTVIIWKSTPAFINTPFEWAPLFTAEKFNDRPGLNEDTPAPPLLQPWKGRSFEIWNVWRGALSENLQEWQNKSFLRQIFFAFYNKEIYKHIL